jgi:hypothetical protein
MALKDSEVLVKVHYPADADRYDAWEDELATRPWAGKEWTTDPADWASIDGSLEQRRRLYDWIGEVGKGACISPYGPDTHGGDKCYEHSYHLRWGELDTETGVLYDILSDAPGGYTVATLDTDEDGNFDDYEALA